MATSQLRAIGTLARSLRAPRRTFTISARHYDAAVPASSQGETAAVIESETKNIGQAPNRLDVWTRNQKPRSKAMTGPRFEQTDFDVQV